MFRKIKNGISIIIPTFNRAKYLYATLICLCSQKTERSFEYEIVIVDSGDDETEDVVEKIKQISIVHVIYKKISNCKNRSLLRNTGAKLSNYEILVFLDNDMLTPPDFVKNIFYLQNNNPKQITLGYRRCLTDFSLDAIGEETLKNNFSILEKLPFYNDERLEKNIGVEPWRFVYSHTMAVYKSTFFEVEGFNKKFGQQWGVEDIELGFKFAEHGCSFAFIDDCFTYHQPHFNQSVLEQRKTEPNRILFAKLHSCFEVELLLTFYQQYEKYYPALTRLCSKEKYKIKGKTKFDLVIARVHSMSEVKTYSTELLGVYIPADVGKYKNTLICKQFYEMPEAIQRTILSEAYRVSQYVYFENCTEKNLELIKKICFDINIVLTVEKNVEYLMTRKIKDSNKTAINCVLPDVLNEEKRVIYQWLLSRIKNDGELINIQDIRKEKSFIDDDFSLPEKYLSELKPFIDSSYGNIPYRTINSFFYLHNQNVNIARNTLSSFILHDDECIYGSKELEKKGYENCVHLDESCFNLLSFMCVENLSHSYKPKDEIADKPKSFCCFMNNGFYEDGIDLVLESFSKYKKENEEAILSIRTLDINEVTKNCYPQHNESSKKNKIYSTLYRYTNDLMLLQNEIRKMDLEKNVSVFTRRMSLLEAFDFIDCNSSLVFAARTCCVPPQVFISVVLKKNTIIASHHSLMSPFSECCVKVESEIKPFSEELKIPTTIENISLSLGRINTGKLFEAFSLKANKVLEQSAVEQLLKCGIEIYEKVKNIPCRAVLSSTL